MNIALLGADPDSVLLATAAHQRGHSIVWAGDTDWARQEYSLQWLPEQDQSDRWEALLDDGLCDAVIVGRGSVDPAVRQEQLANLLKNGITVISSFPLMPTLLPYYEIDMVRNESGALLRYFNPQTEPQEIHQQCQEWIDDGHDEIGQIEQIQWERPLSDRSRDSVQWNFARDAALLERFAGRLDRLGAHGPSHEAENWSTLSVQLIGQQQLPVQWMVRPGGANEQVTLKLIGERGEVSLLFDSAGRPVELIERSSEQPISMSFASYDPSESAIERLEESIAEGGEASNWSEALHCMELADTIEISLRRGRMIDVYNQQLTENLAFKGTMSALGCGVIMILPPLLLLFGWLAELVGLPVAEYWPHVLLALLSLFLMFQFLPKLLGPATNDSKPAESE